jgi:hypothetical protein
MSLINTLSNSTGNGLIDILETLRDKIKEHERVEQK